MILERFGTCFETATYVSAAFGIFFGMFCNARFGNKGKGIAKGRFFQILLTFALGSLAPSVLGQSQSPVVFTNLAQVRALPISAAANHRPFKLRAVVTYSDPDWKVLFVQNGASGAFVDHGSSEDDPNFKLTQGQVVDFEGTIARGLVHCNLSDRHTRVVGESPMPPAMELVGPADFNDTAEGRWVRFTGWVMSQTTLGNRVSLNISVSPGKSVMTIFPGMDNAQAESLRGALVEVTGVLALKINDAGKPSGDYLVFNQITNAIRKLRELPSISPDLLGGQLDLLQPKEPVRVAGLLGRQDATGAWTVRAETNSESIRVACAIPPYVTTGSLVEIIGFPSDQNGSLIVTNAFLTAIAREPFNKADVATNGNTRLREITKVGAVRKLSAKQAARGYPVHVVGVLTFFDPTQFNHYVQDDTAGIYLDLTRLPDSMTNLVAGQKLEVFGFSGPGDFAPVINVQSVRVIENQSPFPKENFTVVHMLMTGTQDSQWVSLRGVVRQQRIESNKPPTLLLNTGEGQISLNIPISLTQPLTDFVDAAVEVSGVCRTVFNDRRQLESVELDVPDWAHIQIIESAPADPFELPIHPITDLFQFHAGGGELHRVHLQGRSLLRRGDGSFFVQDATGGIHVEPWTSNVFAVDKSVEVVGFPMLVDGLPALQDSVVRIGGEPKPLAPQRLTPETARNQLLDSTLVELQGRVIGHSRRDRSALLSIEFGTAVVDAVLDPAPREPVFEGIAAGSIVDVTGVYVARLDEDRKLKSFQILLPSAENVKILSRPSWWSAAHMIWVLGGVGGTLVLALGWIRLLRKKVQQRTAELREEISERKRAELTLRESEARFSAIFHASPVAIALSEKSDGKFVDVNGTFLEMFGHTRAEVIGHTSAELNYLPSARDRSRLVSTLLDEGSQQIETKFRRKSGELFDVLLSAHPVRVGNQTYILGTLLDITERKHLEESLRQSQKMEGIGHLAGGIAHEFNNILGTMMMNLGLARMSDGIGRSGDMIDTLDGSCQKAADLVKQLLAFSRQSVIERRPLNFAAVISGQVKMLRQFLGERIELELRAAPDLPWVKADKGLIEQVLLNLCINARDAMQNAGRVRLELAEEEVGAERAKTFAEARPGKFLRFSVTDTGCGMDERTLKRIFEPFFTTKDIGKGTGLGLATVRGIVQQHQGWIEVESAVGKGSTFRIYLPPTESVDSHADEKPEEKPASGNGTVLLVEDEKPLRSMTHMLLTSHGYKVLEAENGSDALGVWARHRSEIDLIFTDMVMPGNLSGLQLAKQALSEKPDLKVIITSGYHTDLVDLEKTAAASIAYLAKPCPPKTLTATIDRCLGHN